jgi:hypothetical protein
MRRLARIRVAGTIRRPLTVMVTVLAVGWGLPGAAQATASAGAIVSVREGNHAAGAQPTCAPAGSTVILGCPKAASGSPARTGAASRTGMQAAAATSIPGYTPAQLQSAYGLQSSSSGMRETVAIVEPYDDPNAEIDLDAYRSEFDLPACTSSNGCFTKVNQEGAASPLPGTNALWAADISTALDMVSAVCPNCHLLLVETTTPGIVNVGTGVNTAVSLGAKVITTSVAVAETSTDTTYDTDYFNHPGVAITAPAGDSGYGTIEYPAASQYVTAVGGTTLTPDSGTLRGWAETPWNDSYGATNSGCSAYEPKPTWQVDTGCTTRTLNDVAADADPVTGVAVYDTYGTTTSGWQPGPDEEGVGGTAVAAAIIAGVYALAGTPAAGTYPASYPYSHPGGPYTSPGTAYPYSDGLNDITSGSNGTTCSPAYLCTAGPGYDGPTGVGSPEFTTSFSAQGNLQGAVYSGITGKCLDDYQGSTADGNKVDVWACNTNASAQSWTIESDGTVRIGGDCLDVTNGGTSNGTPIQVWSCLGNANQQWQPESDGALVNPQSGKCLDDPSGSTTDGTQLQIYTCNGTGEQQWTLPYAVVSGTGSITSQASTSKCVDDTGDSSSDNNKIQIWDCLGDSAQDWTVEANGTLQINGSCMATYQDGTTDGTEVVLYGCTGDPNQQWIARSDGSLLNRRSGTCLDDPAGNETDGTQLDIATCNQSSAQSWNLP